jgi:Na+-transporting NADH:ubiquinone oxidoreductase subunit F
MMTVLLANSVTIGIFTGLTVMLLVAEKYLASYKQCTVSVNKGSVVFEQTGGVTLLSALYANKIFIPSACGGKGSCGYCKVAVLGGGGPVLPTETPYLNRREIRAGMRLACQVKIKENIELRLPDELLSIKEYRARVAGVRELTHDIKEINLELVEPAAIDQRPGQYVQILAPTEDGPVFRAYSISSPAYDKNIIQLIVRLVPGGIASTYLHGLKENDEVAFTGPYGDFRLSEDPETEIVCVGGGCGMAPIANIVRSILRRWPNRTCYLFFGCRTTSDVFYLEDFQALAKEHPNLKVIYALSDPLGPEERWDGDTGFIHLSVDKYLAGNSRHQAFLCGPPPMIEAVTRILDDRGFRKEEIFYDAF